MTEHLWRPAIADANYQNAGVYEPDRSTATAYEESRVIEKTQKLLPASSRSRTHRRHEDHQSCLPRENREVSSAAVAMPLFCRVCPLIS